MISAKEKPGHACYSVPWLLIKLSYVTSVPWLLIKLSYVISVPWLLIKLSYVTSVPWLYNNDNLIKCALAFD